MRTKLTFAGWPEVDPVGPRDRAAAGLIVCSFVILIMRIMNNKLRIQKPSAPFSRSKLTFVIWLEGYFDGLRK